MPPEVRMVKRSSMEHDGQEEVPRGQVPPLEVNKDRHEIAENSPSAFRFYFKLMLIFNQKLSLLSS